MLKKYGKLALTPPYIYASTALLVLIVAGFGYYQLSHLRNIRDIDEPEVSASPTSSTSPVSMKDSSSPKATSIPKSSNPPSEPANNSKLDIELTNDIYNYTSSGNNSSSTGVRNPDDSTSWLKKFFVTSTYATSGLGTRAYPVIYTNYTNNGTPNPLPSTIYETNLHTGIKTSVLSEPTYIYGLDFSTKQQSIVYTLADASANYPGGGKTYSAKLYNLNTKATTTIIKDINYPPEVSWSPDGKSLAVFVPSRTSSEKEKDLHGRFYIYTADTKSLKEIVIGANISPLGFSWSDDGNTLIALRSVPAPSMFERNGNTYIHRLITVDLKSGNVIELQNKLNTNSILMSPVKIGDKVFGVTADGKTASINTSKCNYGWISYTNLSTNKSVEYRDEAGDCITNYQILVDAKGENVFFSTQDTNIFTLRRLDISSGKVTTLPAPDSRSTIIGWNGNYENLVIQASSGYFYNLAIESKELTRLTQ